MQENKMGEVQIFKKLEKAYYNPAHFAGFIGSVNSLKKSIESDHTSELFKKRSVQKWLEKQETYNTHRMNRHRFERRCYNVSRIDDVWEADLIDVRNISSYNNNIGYLLVVIDVLSKFVWVEPVINKSNICVVQGFKKILKRAGSRKPRLLQTDRGKEFLGSLFQELLKKQSIIFRTVRNPDVKAAVVERFNRTLKERLWRYFTHARSKRYVEVLQKIVHSYNHAKHSGIKMAPYEVNKENAEEAFHNLQKRYVKRAVRQPKYNAGELVRISKAKAPFVKGYESGWSKEIFKIASVSAYRQPIVYLLKDLNNEAIDGIFYTEELSRVQ